MRVTSCKQTHKQHSHDRCHSENDSIAKYRKPSTPTTLALPMKGSQADGGISVMRVTSCRAAVTRLQQT